MKKSDLADKMVSWVVELSEYDITFEFRSVIKYQLLLDFLVELSLHTVVELYEEWVLFVYGLSNLKGNGANTVLEGPREMILEQSL